jgi:hypothetical protein
MIALTNEELVTGEIMGLLPMDPAFVEARDRGVPAEKVVALMRRHGWSIVQACAAYKRLYGVGLGEAKIAVTSNPAYRDYVEAAQPLHDELERYFENYSDEPPEQ